MKVLNYIFGLFNKAADEASSSSAMKHVHIPDVPASFSGKSIAQKMLFSYGLYSVRIETSNEEFSDGYNQADNVVVLSLSTYFNESVIAVATACHEVGHAVAYLSGFQGTPLQNEQKATSIALEFLKNELSQEQYNTASAFLHACMETYLNNDS